MVLQKIFSSLALIISEAILHVTAGEQYKG